MTQHPYQILRPARQTTSVIFASPHSGREYPQDFLRGSVLDERAVRSSEDAFVDMLFSDVPAFGAPLLSARMPRAYVDLNRSHEELDPALIAGLRKPGVNPRVSSGLGVIPRVVSNGRAIYRGKITQVEALQRLDACWFPYHQALQQMIDATIAQFGEAILIDCHSMPHEAIHSMSARKGRHPQVILGDRFGAAARGEIVDQIEAAFVGAGLRVGRNSPFAGAYIAQHYGRPSRRQHAVQIEIDRALYMDERTIRPSEDFESFRRLVRSVARKIAGIGRDATPLAAE